MLKIGMYQLGVFWLPIDEPTRIPGGRLMPKPTPPPSIQPKPSVRCRICEGIRISGIAESGILV